MALNIIFGWENTPYPETQKNNAIWFRHFLSVDWFSDTFIQDMMYRLNGDKVLAGYALITAKGIPFSPDALSSGMKTLILLYTHPERVYYGSQLGDNCVPMLLDIADKHDITIALEHLMRIPKNAFSEHVINVNGKRCPNFDVYWDAKMDWAEYWELKQKEEDEKEDEIWRRENGIE